MRSYLTMSLRSGMRLRIVPLMAVILLLQGCINEPEMKVPFSDFSPTDIADGWRLSTPSLENIDSLALRTVYSDFHADEASWQARSLSVYRNGALVAESYTKDVSDRVKPRAIWSATKQVVGVLVGIALDRRIIRSLDDSIVSYLPEVGASFPDKAGITIRDLLTMRSGIGYNNYGIDGDDSQIMQGIPDSYLRFILGKQLLFTPGEEFDYKDSDPQLLATILERATGRKLDEWADDVLFSHIGLRNYRWLGYRDGSTYGSFGIMTTPREMAKITQLVLNGGIWRGTRIVSKAWVEDMTAPLVDAGDKAFGYQWWSYPEHGTYFMNGNGRQLAFVFPAQDLVVVITSETNVQGKFNLPTPVGRNYASRIAALCR